MKVVGSPGLVGCGCDPVPGSWWRLGAGAFLAANGMAVALAVNTSDVTADERGMLQWASLSLSLVVFALLGDALGRGLLDAIRRPAITVEALFALGIGGAMGVSLLSMVSGRGPVYFEVCSILLVVYRLGNELSRYTKSKVEAALLAWTSRTETCWRVDANGVGRTCPARDLQVGDRIRIHPGGVVAVDGLVVEGEALLLATETTGERLERMVSIGDAIAAGSGVLDATITVQATRIAGESSLRLAQHVVMSAHGQRGAQEAMADRMARWFVPLVVCIAVATFGCAWWLLDLEQGLFRGLSVLLVACPCALGFATPLTLWSARHRLQTLGLQVRDGHAVESLASCTAVVFDVTGTLTEAEPQVLDSGFVCAPSQVDRFKRLVGAAESLSAHPVAKALTRAWPQGEVEAASVQLLPGRGIAAAVLDGDELHHVSVTMAQGVENRDGRRVEIAIDGIAAGWATVGERLRDAIGPLCERLATMGLEVALMSGDGRAREVARGVRGHFGLLPSAKHDQVQAMQRAGLRVAYVGDGVNDVAAMSASVCAIAMRPGGELVEQLAAIVWNGERLEALPEAIAVCRAAVGTLRGNLWLAAGYNVVGIALAISGWLHPVGAALLMTASSATVAFRALQGIES